MSRARLSRRRGAAGFTLVEALVAVAVMGLTLLCLGDVTGQWMRSWHRGFGRVQRLEELDIGLRRIVADLNAAEFVTANKDSPTVLFIGEPSAVTLVRAATSPGSPTRLEFVSFAALRDDRGLALIRVHAPFTPLALGRTVADQLSFTDPVALVRAPYLVSFAFAGPDRVWRDSWRDAKALPTAVRIQVRDAETGALTAASTATHPPIDAPAQCVGKKSIAQCLAGAGGNESSEAPDTPDRGRNAGQSDG